MRHEARKAIWLLLGAYCLLLAAGSLVAAQTGAGYDLSWWTVDGGGTWSSGEGYALTGSAGQPDAVLLAGGGYTLGGGFWRGGETAVAAYKVYLPLVLR